MNNHSSTDNHGGTLRAGQAYKDSKNIFVLFVNFVRCKADRDEICGTKSKNDAYLETSAVTLPALIDIESLQPDTNTMPCKLADGRESLTSFSVQTRH
jgi:hypothetical protein